MESTEQIVLTVDKQGELVPFDKQNPYAEVVVPEGVRTIPQGYFKDLWTLQLVLPSTLETVARESFVGSTVAELVFSSGEEGSKLFELPERIFHGWNALQKVVLPRGLKRVGSGAFDSCKYLAELVLPEGLEEIGSYAFACTKVKNIFIPDGVKKVGVCAFLRSGLQSLSVPASIEKFEREVFSECGNLKEFIFRGTREQYNRIEKYKRERVVNHYDNSRVGYDWSESRGMVEAWIQGHRDMKTVFKP